MLLLLRWPKRKDNGFYETIRRAALPRIAPINAGNIENFKSITPPKDTWRYEDLEALKKDMETATNEIFYGYFIEPSTQEEGVYAVNAFAFRKVGEDYDYYYAAIVPIDTNDGFRPKTSYLFTVDVSLKSWWMHTFGVYESELLNDIPEQYSNGAVCPPPHKANN